jgi:tetratricopeptide (TPR) repeat protein
VDHVKLFRNRPDLRFELRIHEQILSSIRRVGGEIARAPIRVIHAHYDRSQAGQIRKRERDRGLLELDLAEHPDHPFVHFNVGMTALHNGETERAIHHLRRSIELAAPQESHVRKTYALLASAYRTHGDIDRARQLCERGLALFPHDPELLFHMGIVCHEAGDLAAAEAALSRLLSVPDPSGYLSSMDSSVLSFKARHNLAAVYQSEGRHAEAERCWRHVTRKRPDFLPAWLAVAEMMLGAGRVQEANALVDEAAGPGGETAAALLRGLIAFRTEKLAEAKQYFHRATELAPELDVGHRYLSHALLRGGERRAVKGVLRKLIELAPDDGEAHHNLGCLLIELGRHEEGLQHLELAVRLRPAHAPSRQMLAQARRRVGR